MTIERTFRGWAVGNWARRSYTVSVSVYSAWRWPTKGFFKAALTCQRLAHRNFYLPPSLTASSQTLMGAKFFSAGLRSGKWCCVDSSHCHLLPPPPPTSVTTARGHPSTPTEPAPSSGRLQPESIFGSKARRKKEREKSQKCQRILSSRLLQCIHKRI